MLTNAPRHRAPEISCYKVLARSHETRTLGSRVSRLAVSGRRPAMATVRERAPAFSKTAVVGSEFRAVSLAEYAGRWVILSFFPMAFTFVCPTELVAYADRAAALRERDAELLFASTDSQYDLLAWNQKPVSEGGLGNITVPLLADTDHALARDYGVLIEEDGTALRGTFLIDPEGVVRQITINNLPVGRSVDETVRVLDALKFTREHGEQCDRPVGTTQADPDKMAQ